MKMPHAIKYKEIDKPLAPVSITFNNDSQMHNWCNHIAGYVMDYYSDESLYIPECLHTIKFLGFIILLPTKIKPEIELCHVVRIRGERYFSITIKVMV